MTPTLHRQAVPNDAIVAALRVIWDDLMRRGLLPDEVDNYRRSHDWFPWLKTRRELARIRGHVVDACDPAGEPCPPQIVFQPPDDYDGDLVAHIDETPDRGRYRTIVGVALTHQCEANGGLHWWDNLGHRQPLPALAAGDAVAMPGGLPHASGPNRTGMPRIALYLRWL